MYASATDRATPRVFGRGSPVHAYWVERCVGFTAIEADGRRLGRIRRVEAAAPESTLVIGRLRRRTIPATAVDSVWPREAVVLIAEPDSNGGAVHDRGPAPGDTIPWFDLARVDETAPPARGTASAVGSRIGEALRAGQAATVGGARAVRTAGKTAADSTRLAAHTLRRRLAALLVRLARAVDAPAREE